MIIIKIKTENAAFIDPEELGRILRKIAIDADVQNLKSKYMDINGNPFVTIEVG